MKRLMAGLAVLLLAGCYTPGELVKSGTRWDYTSALAPKAAAECIARNGNERGSMIHAFARPMEEAGGFETVVRNYESAMVVAQARPSGQGADVAAFITYNLFPKQGFMDALMAGCAQQVAAK
jgi:hypothetical protein